MFKCIRAGATITQNLSQFLRIHAHAVGDILIRLLDICIGRIKRIALRFSQFQRLVNETVDRFLSARLFMGAHFEKFLAMRDIEIGDRRAVHE